MDSMKSIVLKVSLIVLAVLAVGSCGTAAVQSKDSASQAALDFVIDQNAGGNLLALAKAAARRTQTFSLLAVKLGRERASVLVDEQIVALMPDYQRAWYRRTASVYAVYFSEDELKSLAKDGDHSQYATKWDSQRERIGADLRANSQLILSRLLAEALENAVIKAGGVGSTEARSDSRTPIQS
jgi:hypothetical protein